jgi:hypothetical protein
MVDAVDDAREAQPARILSMVMPLSTAENPVNISHGGQ